MSDEIKPPSPIKCPNCDTEMIMDEDCDHCGYSDLHDRDTKEIPVVVVPMCEADNCKRISDDITIVVGGQKRIVCDCCAEAHYEQLNMQHNEEHIEINEERVEGIEGV